MKIIKSNFCPEGGFATIVLQHNGKKYIGQALYNEKEEKYPANAFFGQRIAERRAVIQLLKEKRDINRIKKEALESLKKDLKNTYGIEENLFYNKLDQHIKYYNKEYKDCKNIIELYKSHIKRDIELRQQLLDRVTNK